MLFARSLQPPTKAKQTSTPRTFLAPKAGLIKNENIAKPNPLGAEWMDNWFPTAEGCRMRKGSDRHATIAAAVKHLAAYEAGAISKLFAMSASAIYDITTPADPDVSPAASVSGLLSGDWSSVQFTNSGGSFLMMANGADNVRRYDGSAWLAITDVSTGAITGVATTGLSAVWKFKSRLFFVQGGTMSAWYLGVNSIAGALTELPLGAIFSEGSSLLFGASVSYDAGNGPDDYCVFVTTNGEMAVYQGSNPSDANNWALVGVYRIGKPLHKNAWFKAGGDLGIMTDDGVISALAAMKTDRAGLRKSAISFPIETLWRKAVDERFSGVLPFSCVMWPAQTMLVVGIPANAAQSRYNFVVNTGTGAWTRFTGWDIRCLVVYKDALYFGTSSGTIVQGDVTGSDEGEPYSAVVIPKMSMFGSPNEKVAVHCRMIARANNEFVPQLFANADYEVDIPTVLDADPDSGANVWGVAVWGEFTWGANSDQKVRQTEWQSVSAVGTALAPGLQITSGRETAPDVELIALVLMCEDGEIIG